MKHTTDTLRKAERMVPLIRSISREARERARAIRQLEADLEELSTRHGEAIGETRRVESELFLQRREIERVEKELARLGCRLDPGRPERIVCSAGDEEVSFEEWLDETGFRPDPSGSKS